MLNKKEMPLRSGNSNKGKASTYQHFTEEFSESQAERIFNRDMNAVVAAAIVILLLAILGVI